MSDGSCSCGRPDCESIGKHPIGRLVPHGVTEATTDTATLTRWWTEQPHANVGVATGARSGFVAFDVDDRHGGDESLRDWTAQYGELPITPRSLTGGGIHILFAYPGHSIGNGEGGKTVGLPVGIDRRGDGGYIVVPPSVHPSKKRYRWEVAPEEAELTSLPLWLDNHWKATDGHVSVAVSDAPEVPERIAKGARNAWLASYAGTMRRRGATFEEIYAALSIANATRCDPPLPDYEVRSTARSIAARPAADPISANGHVSEPVVGEIWSTSRLLGTHFAPLRWVVENLIPEESLTILGGKKKVGKSWLARQIAGAVGSGDAVFGRKTIRGHVLYYCLEDGERRLRSRLQLQEASEEEDVDYVFHLSPLNEGGADELETRVKERKPLLTVIDTLAAAKSAKVDENAAGPMADLINQLQRLARSAGTGILLVAHHGKSSFGDSGHDIRGSSAIAAAADVNLGLYKQGEFYRLTAEGRDIEEGEFRMEFEDFRWKLRGDERSLSAQESEDEVVEIMTMLGEVDAGTIARELSRARSGIDVVLKRLLKQGRVSVRSDREPGRMGRSRMLYRLTGNAEIQRYDLKD